MVDCEPLVNALTVDVEDYFHATGLATGVRCQDWPSWPARVGANVRVLLDLFARYRVRGTFFVLGWVAERDPTLVRDISAAGHEVACHGFEHRLIYRQTPDEFRADIRRAKLSVEDLIGMPVVGYRAPSYSITSGNLWALDILIEEGFRYDSSIFPVHHDRYGIPTAERFPYRIRRAAGEIDEFPPSTVRLGGINVPMAGGGYFRLLPYGVFRRCLRHINTIERRPAVFLVHPWEVDPHQPRVHAPPLNVWRHHVNLRRTLPRLKRLLDDFAFAPIRDVLPGQLVEWR